MCLSDLWGKNWQKGKVLIKILSYEQKENYDMPFEFYDEHDYWIESIIKL